MTLNDPVPQQPSAGNAGEIDLRLAEIGQLFQTLDPTPFPDRDLDSRAEEFIVEWAAELPNQAALALTIHLSQAPQLPDPERTITQSIRNYFGYRAEQTARQYRELIRQGWKDLGIGLVFLFTCLLSARLLEAVPEQTFVAVLRESLIIGGWVAMWRPLETFLYSRWPLRRRQLLYERLGRMHVRLEMRPPP